MYKHYCCRFLPRRETVGAVGQERECQQPLRGQSMEYLITTLFAALFSETFFCFTC